MKQAPLLVGMIVSALMGSGCVSTSLAPAPESRRSVDPPLVIQPSVSGDPCSLLHLGLDATQQNTITPSGFPTPPKDAHFCGLRQDLDSAYYYLAQDAASVMGYYRAALIAADYTIDPGDQEQFLFHNATAAGSITYQPARNQLTVIFYLIKG